MEVIRATQNHTCTECRKETKVIDVKPLNGILTIMTECTECEIRYTKTFKL